MVVLVVVATGGTAVVVVLVAILVVVLLVVLVVQILVVLLLVHVEVSLVVFLVVYVVASSFPEVLGVDDLAHLRGHLGVPMDPTHTRVRRPWIWVMHKVATTGMSHVISVGRRVTINVTALN